MKKLLFAALSLSLIFTSSCDKDGDKDEITAQLPSSYNFENVNHSGQDQRLDMLSEIVSYAKTSNSGSAVNAQLMFDMMGNKNYQWQNTDLNSSSKQIASKLEADASLVMGDWIRLLDSISQNPNTGSNGVAGLVSNQAGTKQYLFNEQGYELAQLIEKGSIGALSYYQATAVYTSSTKMNVDNDTVNPGKGTDMQHHWDEAFGYFSAPKNFAETSFSYDNTQDYHRFWVKYSHELNEVLGCDAKIMKAFIKGRNAINNNNLITRDVAITELRQEWQKVCAGMAIHYLNGAKADFADDALRNHQLSEAVGFLWSLRFNPSSPLNAEAGDKIIKDSFSNLYEITTSDINAAIDLIATNYGLQSHKNHL